MGNEESQLGGDLNGPFIGGQSRGPFDRPPGQHLGSGFGGPKPGPGIGSMMSSNFGASTQRSNLSNASSSLPGRSGGGGPGTGPGPPGPSLSLPSGGPGVPDVDLSGLTAEERAMIESVMARAQQETTPEASLPPK